MVTYDIGVDSRTDSRIEHKKEMLIAPKRNRINNSIIIVLDFMGTKVKKKFHISKRSVHKTSLCQQYVFIIYVILI